MKIILEELKRVEKLFAELSEENSHRVRKYEDDLEWWILGRFKCILDFEGINFPDYAKKLEIDDTDFIVSFDGINKYKSIQITECVPSDLLKSKKGIKINIWEIYVNVLMKKLNCNFGPDNWLVIYFDNRYSQISSNGNWHTSILRKSLNINLSNCKFDKVVAIDCMGRAAVEIFPFNFVICPEWRNKSTIIDQMIFRKDNYYRGKI